MVICLKRFYYQYYYYYYYYYSRIILYTIDLFVVCLTSLRRSAKVKKRRKKGGRKKERKKEDSPVDPTPCHSTVWLFCWLAKIDLDDAFKVCLFFFSARCLITILQCVAVLRIRMKGKTAKKGHATRFGLTGRRTDKGWREMQISSRSGEERRSTLAGSRSDTLNRLEILFGSSIVCPSIYRGKYSAEILSQFSAA